MDTAKKSSHLDDPYKGDDDVEEIENIKLDNVNIQTELSSIESTAASKAAWLISIVVSIGGFLFGMSLISERHARDQKLTSIRLRYGIHLFRPGYHRHIPRSCIELERTGNGDLFD
jgi:hypothetical protein